MDENNFLCPYHEEMSCPFVDTSDNTKFMNCGECPYIKEKDDLLRDSEHQGER
jgi:hypothetical protein